MTPGPPEKRSPDTGFIPPGLHSWWLRGVFAGAIVVGILAMFTVAQGRPALAWGGALATAAVFAFMFDERGVFRAGRLVGGIAAVIVIERLLVHGQRPSKIVLVLFITGLLVVYSFGGAVGMAIGARRRDRVDPRQGHA